MSLLPEAGAAGAGIGAGSARRPPFLRRDVVALVRALQRDGLDACLAVVTHTEGSTYSKPGTVMLFAADGRQAGLVSGGCVEGDLAERAARVVATGTPMLVTYDARDVERDVLFGLALGCEGLLQAWLIPSRAADGHAPLAALADAAAAGETAYWSVVTAGGAAGTTHLESPAAAAGLAWTLPGGHAAPWRSPAGDAGLLMRLAPPPQLALCGAGAEAGPLVVAASTLGWDVDVLDHRAAWAVAARFPAARSVRCADPRDGVPAALSPAARYDAVVVMAHHLEADEGWLRALAGTRVPWIGLLGPAARRARLLAALGDAGQALAGRLHGPVGVAMGARTPEEIALSILAAAQQSLALDEG